MPQIIRSPVAQMKGRTLIPHRNAKKNQKRIEPAPPRRNPYSKYLVEGTSLVFLEQVTEEANERARLAQEALLGERAFHRYNGWWETPYENIIENEQKILKSLRDDKERLRLQKEEAERKKLENYNLLIQNIGLKKQRAMENSAEVIDYIKTRDNPYHFVDDKRF